MKHRPKLYLYFTLAVVVLLFLFKPVPEIERKDALRYQGTVKELKSAGNGDLQILMDDGQGFYLNEVLQAEDELLSWQLNLLNQPVELLYPDYWSPLDPAGKMKHVSELSIKDSVLFSEFSTENQKHK